MSPKVLEPLEDPNVCLKLPCINIPLGLPDLAPSSFKSFRLGRSFMENWFMHLSLHLVGLDSVDHISFSTCSPCAFLAHRYMHRFPRYTPGRRCTTPEGLPSSRHQNIGIRAQRKRETDCLRAAPREVHHRVEFFHQSHRLAKLSWSQVVVPEEYPHQSILEALF